jgi:nicotinate-nucleotide--dimethylbenzimidazole phosphoribosyltransferase
MTQGHDQRDSEWVNEPALSPDTASAAAARAHQLQLTKPPGSLGRLETIVEQLAALQGVTKPTLERIMIRVFAGDHGVATQGVSAFPQAVTVEMLRNFAAGGAAISVLAAQLDADFGVINMGTVQPADDIPGVICHQLGPGTRDFTLQAALSARQLDQALAVGRDEAEQAGAIDTQLFIGGEMGIGNTTAASALACALLDQPAECLVGRGTGVDEHGLQRKCEVVAQALALHRLPVAAGLPALRCLGGFEIAALTGCYIACAQRGIPSLVDGFISSVAALAAVTINPTVRDWLFFSHQSAEVGHAVVLDAMQASALVALEMRLGEGSGAAIVLPLMRAACLLHSGMATFADAGVSSS